MDRTDYVLAVMAASDGVSLTPVQVQKLFFLLDQKIGSAIGGPRFRFTAFDYGPFDKAVYEELEALAARGDVEIEIDGTLRKREYRPTPPGLERGRALLARFPTDVSDYVRRLSAWVRSRSFADLVAAVYREYPEMKANSVFRY
jgi:hypothetical protein